MWAGHCLFGSESVATTVHNSGGFSPLAVRLLELELQRVALSARAGLPPPTVLDTPERRRAYFMGQVFGNDGLLRLIVLFL
jgi:hypothetical protein